MKQNSHIFFILRNRKKRIIVRILDQNVDMHLYMYTWTFRMCTLQQKHKYL